MSDDEVPEFTQSLQFDEDKRTTPSSVSSSIETKRVMFREFDSPMSSSGGIGIGSMNRNSNQKTFYGSSYESASVSKLNQSTITSGPMTPPSKFYRDSFRMVPLTEQPKGKFERRKMMGSSAGGDHDVVFNMQQHPLFWDAFKEDATGSANSSPLLGFKRNIKLTEHSKLGTSERNQDEIDTDQQKRETILANVKKTCDLELESFMEAINKQLEVIKEEENEADHEIISKLESLSIQFESFARTVYSLSLDEIREGKCSQVVDEIAALQQNCMRCRSPWRENVTKLLLIVSRVSRIVEHLELIKSNNSRSNQQSASTQNINIPTLNNQIKQQTEESTPQMHRRTRSDESNLAESPKSKIKAQPFFDEVSHEVNNSIPPFLLSGNTSPNTSAKLDSPFTISPQEKIKTTDSKQIDQSSLMETKEQKEEGDIQMLCRICEEMVPVKLLEEHSKQCAIDSKKDPKVISCDERIAKFIKAMDRRLSDTNQTMDPQDLSIFKRMQEILYNVHKTNIDIEGSNATIEKFIDQINSLVSNYQSSIDEEVMDGIPTRINTDNIIETFSQRILGILNEKLNLYYELADKSLNQFEDQKPIERDEELPTISSPLRRTLNRSKSKSKLMDKPRLDDFQILKPISRGAFGKVFLAQKKKTGDLYAIKVLNKDDLRKKNQIQHIRAERDILAQTQNHFLVKFYYSFQTRQNLYMVMEYLSGGDLYSLLLKFGIFDEDMAQQYVAEVVLALEYLHANKIIHRDIKPDNLLLGHDGHIKLSDFGLSKYALYDNFLTEENFDLTSSMNDLYLSPAPSPPASPNINKKIPIQNRRYSLVGTPDYLAPEIILGKTNHDYAVDWWALGVVLYEFLVGIPPFNDETPALVFEHILNRDIPSVEDEISPESWDLINRLLEFNPEERLGANGADEVKMHPFFANVQWETLYESEAIWVPELMDNQDTSCFDENRARFEMVQENQSPMDEEDHNTDFLNFSFKHLPNLESLTMQEHKLVKRGSSSNLIG
eukprot:TRINITY_DN2755_c0_g1_i2.p1 TRINITY_DN2755_c0_g1~~TRINITY_DN2755_c0_g1_i2.p1  ORF type:complete len:1006 (+),score=271.24 TRINITY_DN2755_c0_g1_i2:746-3763(+)